MSQDHQKFLIVNADDFGLSPGINRGIITAHTEGIVTSTSLMTRHLAAAEAAELAAQHLRLSIGLHIDLGEWVYRDGDWRAVYEVVDMDDRAAVKKEVEQQLSAFRQLMGRDPTHMDSHQHAHNHEPVREVVMELAGRLNLPLRHVGPIRYCGDFYGQMRYGEPNHSAITVDSLLRILQSLSPGATELACHPGETDVENPYGAERRIEIRSLCDPAVRNMVSRQSIRLLSFTEWRTMQLQS